MFPGRAFGGGGPGGGPEDLLATPNRNAPLAARQAQAAQAAIAAQKAAKAYFDNLLFNAKGSIGGQPRISGGMSGSFVNPAFQVGLDMGSVEDPGLVNPAFEQLGKNVVDMGGAVSSLADSFGSMFEEIVTGSGNAGRALMAGISGSLAGVASMMGDIIIFGSIGMKALGNLNPFAAIPAGLALKALAGVLRGVGNKNAPAFSTATSPTRPRGSQFDENARGGTTIIVDNFIGSKTYIQDLVREINKVQRNTGARVVFHGA
jgi:hypothetical protein